MGTGAHSEEPILASRARVAPAGPGVYVFLGADRELLYVGKAVNLRRRLLDHAGGGLGRSGASVGDVLWMECAHEHGALCLEADLVAALAPSLNAVMVDEAFTYVCVDDAPNDTVRIHLTEDAPSGRAYGAFPHLGKGKHSWRAVRTNSGFSALLRLLWVAFGSDGIRYRLPTKLRGSSPPVALDLRFDPSRRAALHDFLSGRSGRLSATLRHAAISDDVPAFMRRPLLGDVEEAEEFYRLGPLALAQLRRRHGIRSGPVDADTFARLVSEDLRKVIGDFRRPERSRPMRGRMSRNLRARRLSSSPDGGHRRAAT